MLNTWGDKANTNSHCTPFSSSPQEQGSKKKICKKSAEGILKKGGGARHSPELMFWVLAYQKPKGNLDGARKTILRSFRIHDSSRVRSKQTTRKAPRKEWTKKGYSRDQWKAGGVEDTDLHPMLHDEGNRKLCKGTHNLG